jgi:hypothetical protein
VLEALRTTRVREEAREQGEEGITPRSINYTRWGYGDSVPYVIYPSQLRW